MEHALQAARIPVLHPSLHPGVAVLQPLDLGQQVVGHHRRDGNGHQHRRQQRNDIGHCQRLHEPALNTRQEKQRQQHQHNDDGGVDDGRAHLQCGPGDQLQWPQPGSGMRGPVFLQPPQHILHPHHRIVDQPADGNRQAAQRHGVDGKAEILEHHHRQHYRQRDGSQGNQRGAQVQQKEIQHHRHHHAGRQQLALERVH